MIIMEKLPGLPAGSVILQQQGVQHSWYQGPTGPEPGLLTIDHPMPHTTNQADLVNPVNMNSVGGGVTMYGRLVGGDDQLVHMSTAANNSALYPKPQYHTPLGEFSEIMHF